MTLPGGATQNKAYDGVQNLTNLKVKTVSQQPLLELTNSYSKRLELNARTRIDTLLGQTQQATTDFTYDKESRLTKTVTDATGNLLLDTESFTLDALGNRIEHSQTLGGLSYDGNNRLTEKGALLDKTTYTYDDNGNLVQKTKGENSTTYLYDSQNRLIGAEDSQHNPIARYGYDPFDRRLWKDVYRSKDGALLTQAQRSYYLYAEEGLIAESQQAISHSNGQNVSTTATPALVNQYGPKPNNPTTTGVLFVKTKNSNNQSVYAYYHHDHLNTPIQATDKYGKVVWAAQYSAFGQVNNITPTATGESPVIDSSLRFPGQIEDQETGLYYNWRRYYDPEVGRYVTQDPIGLEGGVNLYAYVGGNPVNRIDPLGLATVTNSSSVPVVIGGRPGDSGLYGHNQNGKDDPHEQISLPPGATVGEDNPITLPSGGQLKDIDSIDYNGDGVADTPMGSGDYPNLPWPGNGEKIPGGSTCPKLTIVDADPCDKAKGVRYVWDFSCLEGWHRAVAPFLVH